MKTIHIFLFVLLVMTLVCAVASSSAWAASEWLFNGESVTAALSADDQGSFLLEEMKLEVDVVCSGLFGGTVGPGATDEITSVEDLLGNLVTKTSMNPAIDCEMVKKGPCPQAPGELILVFPLGLSWSSELALILNSAGIEVWDDLLPTIAFGFLIECTVLGIKVDTACQGPTGAQIENTAEGLMGAFIETDPLVTPPLKCTNSLGEQGEGLLSGLGIITHTTGGTLTVS